MEEILEKLGSSFCLFFGINEGKLFVQIATKDNEIAYEAETPLENSKPMSLVQALGILFPDEFMKTGIKMPRSQAFFQWDGQKIIKSGEKDILDCETVLDKFPKFTPFVFSYLVENGSS